MFEYMAWLRARSGFHGIFDGSDVDGWLADVVRRRMQRGASPNRWGRSLESFPAAGPNIFFSASEMAGGNPSIPNSCKGVSGSSSRITTFSPYCVGSVLSTRNRTEVSPDCRSMGMSLPPCCTVAFMVEASTCAAGVVSSSGESRPGSLSSPRYFVVARSGK